MSNTIAQENLEMAGSEREPDGQLLGALRPCQGDQSRQPYHGEKDGDAA
jgi:hypothetical protein